MSVAKARLGGKTRDAHEVVGATREGDRLRQELVDRVVGREHRAVGVRAETGRPRSRGRAARPGTLRRAALESGVSVRRGIMAVRELGRSSGRGCYISSRRADRRRSSSSTPKQQEPGDGQEGSREVLGQVADLPDHERPDEPAKVPDWRRSSRCRPPRRARSEIHWEPPRMSRR